MGEPDSLITCVTRSAESTRELGREIGRLIKGAFRIGLTGDLGCGKTVLVQGLARGLEVPDADYVTSPTYTLINEYEGRQPLYHVDLYRLTGTDDIEGIGFFEILSYPTGVVAVEWVERFEDPIGEEHLLICMETMGDGVRKIDLKAYGLEPDNLIRSLEYSDAADRTKE